MIGGHAGGGSHIGTVDFGPAAAEYDENTVILEWYDYLFLGKQNEFATASREALRDGRKQMALRRCLAAGARQIYSLPASLRRQGKLISGDGALTTTTAKSDKPDTFTYDPANPVPTVGGPLCCDPQHLPAGPRDQKEVEARPDVLVYSTPPLDNDVEVTGPVTLDLYAASSAVDTDFTAKLVDVWPNGYAQNLTEGILRARLPRINHRPSQAASYPAKSTNTKSISGPPATSSSRATSSASKFQAATSRASTATSTPASPHRRTQLSLKLPTPSITTLPTPAP